MSGIGVDEKSDELAEHFLSDRPDLADKRAGLAQAIQQAVEDWFFVNDSAEETQPGRGPERPELPPWGAPGCRCPEPGRPFALCPHHNMCAIFGKMGGPAPATDPRARAKASWDGWDEADVAEEAVAFVGNEFFPRLHGEAAKAARSDPNKPPGACCGDERRGWNGGCANCGDPCL